MLSADIEDIGSLKAAFEKGRRAFLLNPSANPSSDTDAQERRTIDNILRALEGSGLEKVVAASTYGAQPGEPAGDLTTLWELEKGLQNQPIPAAINRGAYYMTNWLGLIDVVKTTGKLPTMFPADFLMPMVAPLDLGDAATKRLLSPVDDTGICHVEGPERYTPQHVADAFAKAVGRPVQLEVAAVEAAEQIFCEMGFSPSAAKSYTRMVALTLNENFDPTSEVCKGRVSIEDYISNAVK